MTTPEPAAASCWNCRATIAAEDAYCRHCGKGQGKHLPWYYGHFGIILSVLALGPFSVLLVWKSPLLNTTAKWAYTTVILLFSWYAATQFYNIWQTFNALISSGMSSGMSF